MGSHTNTVVELLGSIPSSYFLEHNTNQLKREELSCLGLSYNSVIYAVPAEIPHLNELVRLANKKYDTIKNRLYSFFFGNGKINYKKRIEITTKYINRGIESSHPDKKYLVKVSFIFTIKNNLIFLI